MNRKLMTLLLISLLIGAVLATAWLVRTRELGPRAHIEGQSPESTTYVIGGSPVPLVDGIAEVDGAVIRIFGEPVWGDLDADGDQDAALILTRDPGGSGTFFYAVAAVREGERFIGTDAMLLGDRIAPQTTEIHDGVAIFNYATRAPGDSFATPPSVAVSRRLAVNPSSMTLIEPPFKSGSMAALQSGTWTWVETVMNDGTVTTPGDPKAFTATFGADGKVSFTTDCNTMFGSYQAEDHRLTFGPLASTKRYCEGAQEGVFAAQLGEVGAYLFVQGELILEIKHDSGTMRFRSQE